MTSPGHRHARSDTPKPALTSVDTTTPQRASRTSWTGHAKREIPCLERDPETWFAETPDELERAKALCGPCPLRELCLQGALERGEPWGVWGGELFDRGRVIARKRTVGRPRKDRAA